MAPINNARIVTSVNDSAFLRLYKQVILQNSKPASSLNKVLTHAREKKANFFRIL